MIVDALAQANDYLEIASHIQDPSQYWKVQSFYNYAHSLLSVCLMPTAHL